MAISNSSLNHWWIVSPYCVRVEVLQGGIDDRLSAALCWVVNSDVAQSRLPAGSHNTPLIVRTCHLNNLRFTQKMTEGHKSNDLKDNKSVETICKVCTIFSMRPSVKYKNQNVITCLAHNAVQYYRPWQSCYNESSLHHSNSACSPGLINFPIYFTLQLYISNSEQ